MLDRDKRIIEYLKSRIEKYENGNKKALWKWKITN